ncbi:MAG TPA: galactose oxidase-like domain-containing protein [Candidatus Sulfotelmatobacter sp.]|nr:galactose oxidase-like domain-containing protein [Candidatus Sulfotelmatobacter sp.]
MTCPQSHRILNVLIPALLIATFFAASPARAAIAVDANVSADQSPAKTTVTTAAFSTTSGNELLLAFVSGDYLSGANTQVGSVSGGGLTWTLVVRTNVEQGTSEIWRAFATSPLSQVTVTATLSHSVVSSMTVLSFTGVNTSGTDGSGAVGATQSADASKGAPTSTLVTTQNGSWVFGVGNDWDNAIARTPGTGQSLVHQDLSSTGDTYWVQMQNSPTPLSGTSVTINDTAPTGDRFNLSVVEVIAATGGVTTSTISGTLSPASLISGSSVTLTLPGGGTTNTSPDGSGNYSFGNLSNGSYIVTPSESGQSFTPPSQNVTIASANISGVNFALQTWSISGNVGTTAAGTTVTLTGPVNASTPADGSGNYTFSGLPNGSYTVTPGNSAFTFNPTSLPVPVNGANATDVNFTAAAVPTYSISGTISPTNLGANVPVALTGSATANTTTDSNGNYNFANLKNGNYTVRPSLNGESFTPASQPANVNGVSIINLNFTAQAVSAPTFGIDATVSAAATAKATTAVSPSFSTTQGNELLLAFVEGDYLGGANTTVTGITGGGLTWVLVQRANAQSGTAEIWRAFSTVPLSNVVVTATLSQKVLSSITIMSFTGVDTTGTNGSGAIGASTTASAKSGAPTATLVTTRNNSWVFGVGNDFDNAIARTVGANQTLVHQDLTSSGDTYWVQRQTNPTPVSGTSVTINDTAPTTDRYNITIVEVLPSSNGAGGGGGTPPSISIASPLQFASVTGTTTIMANVMNTGSVITGVQFLLDSANLGPQVTTAPYSMAWDTTTASAGLHTLTAIAYNSASLSATSSSITVTVDNSGNASTVGSWSEPVSLPAVAVNLILMKNNTVLFYQDGTTPTVWDYLNNVLTNVPAAADLFCSGHTELADGRILIVGGYGESADKMGIANAEIFDPSNNSWTVIPKMAYARWYPSAITLSDGTVIVMGGWKTSEHTNAGIPEVYDPVANTWTSMTNANNPFETYPFIYQLSNGNIVHVNGSEYATVTDMLNLGSQSWSTVDSNIEDGGSSVMYVQDKIMKAGSASDSQMTGASANTTYVIDMTQPSPTWKQTASMAYPRSFMNLTELPDGTVLATGGETDKNGGDISKAVYPAELWSPTTMNWTTMSAMHTPREYHGTAVLLPDGRVMESGMGADFGNVPDELSAEFFSPPYLFKGPRPTITQAPTQITYGQNFFVATPDAATITSAVLMRLGAATHFFNMDARYVPVAFTQAAGGLDITAPANGYLAPPGYYMLFILNSNGVPSIAPFVQIQ